MIRFYSCLFLVFLIPASLYGQQPDTTPPVPRSKIDSIVKPTVRDTVIKDTQRQNRISERPKPKPDTNNIAPVINDTLVAPPPDTIVLKPAIDNYASYQLTNEILSRHPYFGFSGKYVSKPGAITRKVQSKDWLFYLMVLLFLIYAFLKIAFPKYFGDLFRLFFRTTLKQRQIKEQLIQTPLPSLLLNGFYVLSAGLYISFLLEHYHLNPLNNFWLLYLYCCAGLALIYSVKFVGLKISGWLFNVPQAADSYVFVIFVINKMIGILLLPFLVLLAFSTGGIYTTSLVVSWCLVAGLLIYRVILTYTAVRNQVNVNLFHFFLYIMAFEVAPLLLIYRGLLEFYRIST